MPRSPDKLAFALSAASRVSRQQYKRVFDHLLVTDAVTPDITLDDSIDDLRRETAWNLEALGICDFLPDSNYIVSCRPALALLPPSGLPVAFLTGARTPQLLAQIRTSARRFRTSVLLAVDAQPAFPLLPRRYRFTGESLDVLHSFAGDAGLPLIEVPLAAALLSYSASAAEYAEHLRWDAHFEPDWQREDFDPERFRFTARQLESEKRLSRFTPPAQTYRREFRLVDGARSAVTDRTWGRLVAFHWANARPWEYDRRSAELLLPVSVPLPLLYSRALVACSGLAPVIRTDGDGAKFRVYVDIPPQMFAMLEQKLAAGSAAPLIEAL
jgi:hypothetical protein